MSEKAIICSSPIAILIGTYNGERYLPELIESLKAQTNRDFCCFFHDDGSTDATKDIVHQYVRENPELFFEVPGPPTGNPRDNFFFLLRQVDAAYYMFCDQDDVWLPNKVADSFSLLKKNEAGCQEVCVYTDVKIVDQDLSVIDDSFYHFQNISPLVTQLKQLILLNVVVGCTMILNRPLREKALRYRHAEKIFMHDWWIALIATTEGKLLFLNESTMLYRQHGDNAVGAAEAGGFLVGVKKVLKNLKQTVKEKKERITYPKWFAQELCYVIDESNVAYPFIRAFSEIDKQSKMKRCRFYIKNHLFSQNDFKLWTLIWV